MFLAEVDVLGSQSRQSGNRLNLTNVSLGGTILLVNSSRQYGFSMYRFSCFIFRYLSK